MERPNNHRFSKVEILRSLFSLLLIFHFASIFLHAFPWSPFVAKLAPYYLGYINVTGQSQVWAMYKSPFHFDPRFEIEATDTGGNLIKPFGSPADWQPRKLYFIEALFMSNEDFALAFIKYIGGQYVLADSLKGPNEAGEARAPALGLKEIRMRMLKSSAPPHGESRMRLNLDYVLEKEFKVSL
ncbi:hypothetical protein LBMAG56_00710 [Verrucomicrobiota bacterium]|nr:hypothetical protein LBMAG56_00710 [Verrucomicrobiota bacterium]